MTAFENYCLLLIKLHALMAKDQDNGDEGDNLRDKWTNIGTK
jgi:hypothetical protein